MSIAGNAALDALKEEYGGSSCNARRMYVSGRIIGTAMTFFMPTKSLNIAEKLKAARWAKALVKVDPVAKWLAYISQTTKRLEALAVELDVLLFLPMHRIAHIIFGEFDELGRFTGLGLHSFHTLQEAVKSGRIQVRDSLTHELLTVKALEETKGILHIDIKKPNGEWTEGKTIFPKEWSNEQIIDATKRAYGIILRDKNAAHVRKNEYRAIIDGLEVHVFLSPDDMIISAFPFP